MTTISNLDLYENQYSVQVLGENIQNLSISTLIKYQKLTGEFIATYCLDENAMSEEEKYLITMKYILKCQPHLTQENILKHISDPKQKAYWTIPTYDK
jgi:hypothetical protein